MIAEKGTGPMTIEELPPWRTGTEIVQEHDTRFARPQQPQCELERAKFLGAVDQHRIGGFEEPRQDFT